MPINFSFRKDEPDRAVPLISELVAHLEAIKATHGDLPIFTTCEWTEILNLANVEVEEPVIHDTFHKTHNYNDWPKRVDIH